MADRNTPPQKRYFIMFLRRYIAVFYICVISVIMPQVGLRVTAFLRGSCEWLFGAHRALLYLWNLGSKKRHKAATRSCVPQRKVVSDCLEHTVLFLYLWNLGSKKCHRAASRNCVSRVKVCECMFGVRCGLLVYV